MSWSEYLNCVKEILNDNGIIWSTYEIEKQKRFEKEFKKCFKDELDVDEAVDKVMGW